MDQDRRALTVAVIGDAGRGTTSGLRLDRRALIALAALPVAFFAALFAWPLVAIAVRALSWSALRAVLHDHDLWTIAWFTLWQAVVSAAVTLVIGLPGAFLVARFEFPGRRIVTALVTVPFVLPTVAVGAAFLALLPRSWHGTVPAMLLGHVWVNLAVVVRTVGVMWGQLDRRYVAAARTLGASPARAFATVTLPLLRPALGAAAAVVGLFSFTSFGIAKLLGGPRHPTIEVEIARRAVQALDLRGAAALALIQLVLIGSLLVWWAHAGQRRSTIRTSTVVSRERPGTRAAGLAVGAGALVLASVSAVPLLWLAVRSFTTVHGWAAWRSLARPPGRGALAIDTAAAIRRSLMIATTATIVATIVGALASIVIAHGRGRVGATLDAGLLLPLGTSAVTIGFGLLLTWRRLPVDVGSILVPLAHAVVAVPFVVRTTVPVLRGIDPRMREAAQTLGARPSAVLRTIDAPLARRALAAGAAFAFAVSLGEFGATTFLARTGSPTLPLAVSLALGRPGALNLGRADALAVSLAALAIAAVVVAELAGEPLRGARSPGRSRGRSGRLLTPARPT